jgi:Ni,Fe-hydrogenase maturation factor
LDLLELLDGREAVILIDAARTPGGRAGTLYELDLREVTSRTIL